MASEGSAGAGGLFFFEKRLFLIMSYHQYFVYIVTNPTKTVLYTGVTNNLSARIIEHYANRGKKKTFTGRYNCFNLLYFEKGKYIEDLIKREKEIKGWTRKKKEQLIETENPTWRFLNNDIMEWPPTPEMLAHVRRLRSSA